MNLLKYSSVALLLITGACQSSNPVAGGGTADVSISFNLPDPDARWELPKLLGKTLTVVRVFIRVNGPGMDQIEQDLTINPARTRASGTLKVPKGDDRKFTAIVKDENNITQYVGQTTVSIQSNSATVNIVTEGIAPDPVTLSITRVGVWSVDLDWTRNGDNDFDSYIVARAKTPDLSKDNLNRVFLRTILNQNNTDFTDLTTDWNTEYYYAVIVLDTEAMGVPSNGVGIRTGRYSLLSEDNDNPTSSWAWSDALWGSAYRLTAPMRVKVISALYNITDVSQGGTFWALVFTLDINSVPIVLGNKEVTATEAGWFIVDFSAENIFVNGDFYVMMQYNGVDLPEFGLNFEDNDRAWDYDGDLDEWTQWAGTYFMRTFVELEEGGLLKELAPAPPEDANQALPAPKLAQPFTKAMVSMSNIPKTKSSGLK